MLANTQYLKLYPIRLNSGLQKKLKRALLTQV